MYMYIISKHFPKILKISGIHPANKYQVSFVQELPLAANY